MLLCNENGKKTSLEHLLPDLRSVLQATPALTGDSWYLHGLQKYKAISLYSTVTVSERPEGGESQGHFMFLSLCCSSAHNGFWPI